MIVFRASELGRCIRASVADRLGMKKLPVPEWLEKVYAGGVGHEAECIAALERDGASIWHHDTRDQPGAEKWEWDEGQVFIRLPITDHIEITGHLDGIINNAADNYGRAYIYDRVLEVKSPGAWARFERAVKASDWSDPLASRYAWQISAYMVATGLEAVVACLDGETVRTFGVEVPPYDLAEIGGRVGLIEAFVADGLLPGICDQDDGDSCPWRYLHDGQPEVVEDAVLDEMVFLYESAKATEKRGKEMAAEQRDKILAHLGDREKALTASSRVTRYTTTRITYDHDAIAGRLAEVGSDICDYTKTSESSGLRVTRREEPDAES